jgi:hypothetical protein
MFKYKCIECGTEYKEPQSICFKCGSLGVLNKDDFSISDNADLAKRITDLELTIKEMHEFYKKLLKTVEDHLAIRHIIA